MMANVFERSNILTASCNTFVKIRVEISSSSPWRKVWPHSRLFKMDGFSEDEFKQKLSEVLSLTATAITRSRNGRFSKYRGLSQVSPHLRTQSPRKRLLRRLIMIVQKFCFICSVKMRNNIIMAQFKNILVSYMNDDERK